MASETGYEEDLPSGCVDEAGSETSQVLQDIEDRLVDLSEKVALCKMIENDLKDLRRTLERKSPQDVSAPPQDVSAPPQDVSAPPQDVSAPPQDVSAPPQK